MKKLQAQFQVVRLEEVFKTAVEVDGTPILKNSTELRPWNPQVQRDGESLASVKACNRRKRE